MQVVDDNPPPNHSPAVDHVEGVGPMEVEGGEESETACVGGGQEDVNASCDALRPTQDHRRGELDISPAEANSPHVGEDGPVLGGDGLRDVQASRDAPRLISSHVRDEAGVSQAESFSHVAGGGQEPSQAALGNHLVQGQLLLPGQVQYEDGSVYPATNSGNRAEK